MNTKAQCWCKSHTVICGGPKVKFLSIKANSHSSPSLRHNTNKQMIVISNNQKKDLKPIQFKILVVVGISFSLFLVLWMMFKVRDEAFLFLLLELIDKKLATQHACTRPYKHTN